MEVSYPTARARLDGVLAKLGLGGEGSNDPKVEMLESLARGEIDVDEALDRLEG